VATTIAMLEHAKFLASTLPAQPAFELERVAFDDPDDPATPPPPAPPKKNARATTTDEEGAARPVKKVRQSTAPLKALKASKPSNTPQVKVNDLFTSYVGSDSYGYIVTAVENQGKTVRGRQYCPESQIACGSPICITWRSRAAGGQGCWVGEGEKYVKRRGTRYGFGAAVTYLDPCF
jgi:hypothetical protein